VAGLGFGNIDDKQEKLIIALMSEPTYQRAAQAAGVGERTLYRWMDDPAFSNAYARARRQAYQQAAALAQRYGPLAVQTLARICNNEKISPAMRVQAAAHLLRVAGDAIERDDIMTRLEDLERGRELKPAIIDHDAQKAIAIPPAAKTAPGPVAFTVQGGDADHPVLLPPEKVKRGAKPGRKAKKRRAK